jgi:hypothetical protein
MNISDLGKVNELFKLKNLAEGVLRKIKDIGEIGLLDDEETTLTVTLHSGPRELLRGGEDTLQLSKRDLVKCWEDHHKCELEAINKKLVDLGVSVDD